MQVVFVRGGCDVASWTVTVPEQPDLTTVDALARLQLQARRSGGEIRLCGVPARLAGLLDVCGLRREVGG